MRKNIIEYIIANTDYRQKDLAAKLGVSGAQISKWKSGEFIPPDRAEVLRKLAGLFTNQIAWNELVKTKENASAWHAYLYELNKEADHPAYTLTDEPTFHTPSILLEMVDAGIPIPSCPPTIDGSDGKPPLEELFCTFLEAYGRYVQWVSVRMQSIKDEGVAAVAFDLESSAVMLAIGQIPNKVLSEAGADLKYHDVYTSAAQDSVKEEIGLFCHEIMLSDETIWHDYYDYVNRNPYELEDDFESDWNGIHNFLPYGEREILNGIAEVKSLLTSLHKKLDAG